MPPDDPLAVRLRGFGPLGLAAILLVLAGNLLVAPLSALLVLAWAWRSHTPWAEIGLVPPRSWIAAFGIGIPLGIALKLAMKALVMPLLGALPINAAYHYLAGNEAALPGMIFTVVVVAGVGEELLFRGFLFERLGRLLGTGAAAKAAIALLTAALFGLAHWPEQGLPGAEQGAVVGLVLGTIFAVSGRLWVPMIAHAAFDLIAVALIYWDVETEVATFIFGRVPARQADLEQPRPVLAGDEQPISGLVIGDAVQHVANVAAPRARDDIGEVEPRGHLAGRRIDPRDRVGHEDVGEQLALHEGEVVEEGQGTAALGDRQRPPDRERRRIDDAQDRWPSLTTSSSPMRARPQPWPAQRRSARRAKLLRSQRRATPEPSVRPTISSCQSAMPSPQASAGRRRGAAPRRRRSRTSRSSDRPSRPVLSNSRPSPRAGPG